jgi:hypothetical protein
MIQTESACERPAMNNQRYITFGFLVATLSLAACNAGPLLKTGSLTATPVAATKLATPIDRALHLGATSARAQKCGFYFDPVALRTNFLTAETARGTPADALAKTGQAYDFTAKTIAATITAPDTYCTPSRTASVKNSLSAALAGNYEPPVKKVTQNTGGFFGDLVEDDGTKKEKWNPNEIYDPVLNKPTDR